MRSSARTRAVECSLTPDVGLSGSADSLDALQRFLQRTPADTGLAFVVVIHLTPEHESMMAEILQRSTTMPVAQVSDPVRMLPNHVYVTSPGKHLSTSGGSLTAIELAPHKGKHVTVEQMPARLIDYYNLGKKLHLAEPDVTDTSLGGIPNDVPDERALREILKLIERISPPSLVVNRDC